MHRRFVLAGVFGLLCLAAHAADGWTRYQNARYGYAFDVPPGFSRVQEADNSDGGTSQSPEGHATLAVWGANLLVDSFKGDVNDRIESATSEGWDVSYKRVQTRGASWSGSKDDRIFYAHAEPGCDGQAAYFQLDYDASSKDTFDPIIKRMVKTFSAKGECL